MSGKVDVLIIGAGPAGLSAARALSDRGIGRVVVVDREAVAGGIPLFCPHPTFGLTDHFRPMSGKSYVEKLLARVDPDTIRTSTTVTALSPELDVTTSSAAGEERLHPRRILLATGIRETPRSARLVSGDRPLNVLTTGALQRMAAFCHRLPFRRPVVVGSELVSFSALLTLRDCGVRPVAMLESGREISTPGPAATMARIVLGTPVLTSRRLISINSAPDDSSRMESVTVEGTGGATSEIACDSVIFTGSFVPEASLLAMLPKMLTDNGSLGPAVDQNWRLEDGRIYAAGNVLRSVETAAWSAREGAAAGHAIADDLLGCIPAEARRVPVLCSGAVKLSTPSAFAVPGPGPGPLHMNIRMARAGFGRLTLAVDEQVVWRSRSFNARPDRRLRVTRVLPDLYKAQAVVIGFEDEAN